jgi:hypothetical protein
VGFGAVRIFLCGIAGMLLALCMEHPLSAQEKAVAVSAQRAAVSVPFIGCKSDGQIGPMDAPEGTSVSVPLSAKEGQQLAHYSSSHGLGVLGPRGWYCFGAYGSSVAALFLSPQPIDAANMFSTKNGFTGPAIEISHSLGNTMGRFEVAETIARVFPACRAFATRVAEEFDLPASSFPLGPYPRDTLTYKSKVMVEYKTPAQTEGLGTRSRLKKNDSPIEGVAILIGQTPDLLCLSVRLPPDLNGLTSAIVRQFERDAALRPSN